MKKIIKGFALILSTLFLFSCAQQSLNQSNSELSFTLPSLNVLQNARGADDTGGNQVVFDTSDYTFYIYLFREGRDEIQGNVTPAAVPDEIKYLPEGYTWYFQEMGNPVQKKAGKPGEQVTFTRLKYGFYKIAVYGISQKNKWDIFEGENFAEVKKGPAEEVVVNLDFKKVTPEIDLLSFGDVKFVTVTDFLIDFYKKNSSGLGSLIATMGIDNYVKEFFSNYSGYIAAVDLSSVANNFEAGQEVSSLLSGYSSGAVNSFYATLSNANKLGDISKAPELINELSNSCGTYGKSISKGAFDPITFNNTVESTDGLICLMSYPSLFNDKGDGKSIPLENPQITLSKKEIGGGDSIEEKNGANVVETKTFTGQTLDFDKTEYDNGVNPVYICDIPIDDVLSENNVTINKGDTVVFTLEGNMNANITELYFGLAYKNVRGNIFHDLSFENRLNIVLNGNFEIKLPLNQIDLDNSSVYALQLYQKNTADAKISNAKLKVVNYPAEKKVIEFLKMKDDDGSLRNFINFKTGWDKVNAGDKMTITFEGDFPESDSYTLVWFDDSYNGGNYFKEYQTVTDLNLSNTKSVTLTAKNTSTFDPSEEGKKIKVQLKLPTDSSTSIYTITNFNISYSACPN